MSARIVNYALLIVTTSLVATGILLLTTSRAQDAWLYTLHRYIGAALIFLLIPKTRIIAHSLKRRWQRGDWYEWTTLASIALTFVLLVSLIFVLAWTLELLPLFVQLGLWVTPLALHWYSAFAILPFFVWHAYKRWQPVTRLMPVVPLPYPNSVGLTRRSVLGLLGVSALSIGAAYALESFAALLDPSRRFSGSRSQQAYSGNDFPVTHSDTPPDIDLDSWRLRVWGRVSRPLELSYAELTALPVTTATATIDCTLGWASEQQWTGVELSTLLERAQVSSQATQIACRAPSGAFVNLPLDESIGVLIATHVGGKQLNPEHGFPTRLVVPTQRGYHWIKWMNDLHVS